MIPTLMHQTERQKEMNSNFQVREMPNVLPEYKFLRWQILQPYTVQVDGMVFKVGKVRLVAFAETEAEARRKARMPSTEPVDANPYIFASSTDSLTATK